MKLKKLINYINSISTPAYLLLKLSLIISILIMTAAIAILLKVGELSFNNYTYFVMAKELFVLPQSILLIGSIFSAVIDDMIS